jgi:hypothetical protein
VAELNKEVDMLRKMIAEVTFDDPNDVTEVCAALIEHGFDVELGNCGDKDLDVNLQLDARVLTEFNDSDFCNWVMSIVDEGGGCVSAFGPAAERNPGWVIGMSRRLV